MKKTTKIAAALCAAAITMTTSASAQSEAPTDFVTVSGGYLFDVEAPYLYSSYVFAVDENDFFGIESMLFSKDESVSGGGTTIDLDATIITVGAVYQVVQELSDKDFMNYSFGAGLAHYSLDGKDRDTGVSGSDSATSYYVGGSLGYERLINESWSFNTSLRLIHLGDETFEDKGVKIKTDFESIYVGVEAGLVFKF